MLGKTNKIVSEGSHQTMFYFMNACKWVTIISLIENQIVNIVNACNAYNNIIYMHGPLTTYE